MSTEPASAARPADPAEVEAAQLAVLQSDAPTSEKAIACKKLAIFGSDSAVPELAKLLTDEQLASWSRIALEAIPGEAASKALRDATKTLKGRLLVGTINSIGVRRDAESVDGLSGYFQNEDAEVAAAAAIALGQIGNEPASSALKSAFASSNGPALNALAEALVLVAERRHADGQSFDAVKIYDSIREADVPKQRIVESTRGAILARNEAGIALLLETLRSDDKQLFQLALGTAMEFPGSKVDSALATELKQAPTARAALLVQAMADRTDTVILSAVLEAAENGEKVVRLSAIDALQRVGNVSCLNALVAIAGGTDSDLSTAANETLAVLPGEDVDAQVIALLPEAKGDTYRQLIELIGRRRIDAIPDLLKALNDTQAPVRAAALVSLGETVPLDRLSLLISQVVSPKFAEDRPVAVKALKVAAVRMPERDACATELSVALADASGATQTSLLEILSEVGGSKALETLAIAAKSSDDGLQDTSSRLLGKWNGVDAAPVLLDLAKTSPSSKYRIRALRGYLGLARKFSMPPKQRVEMCENAMAAASRTDEKRLALDVLKIHPSVPGLRLAVASKKDSSVAKEANEATDAIAQALRKKRVDVSKILQGQ
ncbi:MAG: HEAT repeat domain-containing protein [Planctomycetota bacterium]